MNRTSDRFLSIQIACLQGFYWMIFCPIASYASIYFLSKDFSNQQIGWIMAFTNIVAIFLQPSLGSFADKYKSISIKSILSVMALACLALLSVLIFADLKFVGIAALYLIVLAVLGSMHPMLNAMIFEYIDAGHNISYSNTRAMGSICFAILSPFVGRWATRFSTDVLLIVGAILFVCVLAILQTLPKNDPAKRPLPAVEMKLKQEPGKPGTAFLLKYDLFLVFLIGTALVFVFHSVVNTFLAQIIYSIGGGKTEFGFSLTIAALSELPAFLGFNYMVSKIKNQTLLKLSSAVYLLRSIIFLLASAIWTVNIAQALQGFSFALFMPAAVYQINKTMREEDKVKGQTYLTGAITLGSLFGSVIGGWLLDKSGVQGMLIFGVIGALVGTLITIYAVRSPKTALPHTAE